MVLAELVVRHTRRHMPTRRVALGSVYLPAGGAAYGPALLAAVVAEHVAELDEEQRDLLPRLVREARGGLAVPRIALRYRLQTDVHGLDRSRHRLVSEETGGRRAVVLELDRHGRGDPQLLGAVLAAAGLAPSARDAALRAIARAISAPGLLPPAFEVRRLFEGVPEDRPPLAGQAGAGRRSGVPDDWRGIASERRWAMEALGLRPGMALDRRDVVARFRRLVLVAHPDHGGSELAAAERLAELSDARDLLLGAIASMDPRDAG